jgi:hypothetical protein
MGLLKPTPGELVDRVTILRLKLENKKTYDRTAMNEESEAIFVALAARIKEAGFDGEKKAGCSSLTGALGEINRLIWDAQDKIRRETNTTIAGVIGTRIALLSDRRWQLKRAIDHVFDLKVSEPRLFGTGDWRGHG